MLKIGNNLKFRTRLYIYFIFVILLLSFLFMSILYCILWNVYRSQTRSLLETQAQQIATNIDNRMDYYLSIAKLLISDNGLSNSLVNEPLPNIEVKLNSLSHQIVDLDGIGICNIQIYLSGNGDSDYEQNQANNINNVFEQFQLDNSAFSSDIFWTGSYLNQRNERVFSLLEKTKQPNTEGSYYLEICLYESELHNFFYKDINSNRITILNNCMVMSSSERANFEKSLELQGHIYPIAANDGSLQEVLGGIRATAFCNTGWEIVIDANMNIIKQNFIKMYLSVFFALLIALAVSGVLVSMMSTSLDKRIEIFRKKIDYLIQWDLTQDLHISGNDEFRQLADALDETRLRILSLIQQTNETNEFKRIAEISALRAQISSHFLFNSLSSIKWLSLKNDKEVLAEAVDKLSSFLRYSLSFKDNYVQISYEVNHLEAYIYLQNLRYHDEVNINIDIDKELFSYKTVKLILQPLVENAIYHGRRKDGSQLNITIYGYDDSENYFLIVEDDGIGITEEQMQMIYNGDNLPHSDGFGLRNVIDRIRMCTRGKGELTIESKVSHYTKIMIKQPHEV